MTDVEIHHGDALDFLDGIESESVDLVLTDPPYSSGGVRDAQKTTRGGMVRGEQWADDPIFCDQMTTGSFVWLMRQVFMRSRRVLKPGASVLCFIDWRQFSNLAAAAETCDLRVNGQIVWDKGHFGTGMGFRSQHEMIMWASRGVPRVLAFDTGNVIQCKRADNEHHPSPKPIELLRKLARVVSEPGDVVVDPFLGGGSTAAALAPLGYRVRGAEIVEGFVRASERHLERSMAQGVQDGLFDEAA